MKNKLDDLIERIKQLPRDKILEIADMYENRAAIVADTCRNNVSATIAIRLRIWLAGDATPPLLNDR